MFTVRRLGLSDRLCRTLTNTNGLRLTSPRRIDLEMTQGWKAPRSC
jgi:hypothetical protein